MLYIHLQYVVVRYGRGSVLYKHFLQIETKTAHQQNDYSLIYWGTHFIAVVWNHTQYLWGMPVILWLGLSLWVSLCFWIVKFTCSSQFPHITIPLMWKRIARAGWVLLYIFLLPRGMLKGVEFETYFPPQGRLELGISLPLGHLGSDKTLSR